MVSLRLESVGSGLFFMPSEYIRVRRDGFVYPRDTHINSALLAEVGEDLLMRWKIVAAFVSNAERY
jgi:hypothetical protein